MEHKNLTLGSLFSGSGSFELAGMLAGIKPIWLSEIEPYALLVTHNRLSNVQHFGDVSKLNGADLPPVDIITFGSPCQGLSQAGLRKGLADERSGLYIQAVRIIKEMLKATDYEFPKFCVFENVPGLLTSNHGDDFITCMDMMQDLNFIPDINILDAQDMGVPQRRKRVYITWINVEYILQKRTNISDSITLQLLTEISLLNLGVLSKAYAGDPKKSGAQERKCCEDGLRKRIKLFSLQKEDHFLRLRKNLEDIQVTCLKERTNLDFYHGEDQTAECIPITEATKCGALKMEEQSMNIGQLLKNVLEESLLLLNESTILTLTKETMTQKIFSCFQALLNTLRVTIRLTQSLGKMPMFLNCYEWVSYTLTEIRGYINAQKKYHKRTGELEWNELLRFYEQEFSALEKLTQRNITEQCGQEALFIRKSLPWHTPQSFREEQGTACRAEKSTRTAGRNICLCDQGGERIDVLEDKTATLRAEAHHPPCVLESAGFCTEHSAKSRSIGYEEEKSPTLRAGVVPAAIALENHPADSRIKISDDEICQTLTSRCGTGGGNVPLLMESPKVYGICAKQSNAMLSDNPHSGFYEAETSRTLDTSNQSPCKNQGGMVVIEGNGSRPSHQGNGYKESEIMYTLNTVEVPAVAMAEPSYAISRDNHFSVSEDVAGTAVARGPATVAHPNGKHYSTSKNSHHTVASHEKANTLVASDWKDPPVVNDTPNNEPTYIVRRLTPTECARLQGLPDWWCKNLDNPNPTDEEIQFWTNVWNEWNSINHKKPKTEKQIRKWLANPYSDSAEYKLYGNGIALPCAWFVLAGIACYSNTDTQK